MSTLEQMTHSAKPMYVDQRAALAVYRAAAKAVELYRDEHDWDRLMGEGRRNKRIHLFELEDALGDLEKALEQTKEALGAEGGAE